MNRKWLNCSLWPIDKTLTGTSTPGQSRPGCNGIDELLTISQSSKTEGSPSDGLVSYPRHSFEEGLMPFQRGTWYLV